MPVIVSKEIEEASQDIVSIVNVGTRNVRLRCNGRPYVFPGKSDKYPNGSIMHVPAGRAWLWPGNPSARSNQRDWTNEVRALENRHGPETWKYISDGNVYVREWAADPGLGKGEQFYGGQLPDESEIEVTALALDDDSILAMAMDQVLEVIDEEPASADKILAGVVRSTSVAKKAGTNGVGMNDAQDVAIARAAGMAELAAGKHR